MSGLNFLNKLLDGVDVEWLSLGELGDFIRGNGLQKKDFVESGFPAIHYGQIYTRYGLSADKTFTYVLPELANKLRKAQKNDLLLATTSENDEDVVKPLAWLGDNVAISGDMMLFRHEQNVKYLAYFFQSEIFQTQKMKYITGAKVRRVSSGDLSKIKIPIPCSNNPEKSLAIQSEIVRILDKFTALTAELTAELNMRKKQYNYYRDQLLSFKEGEVEWKTLGEIGNFTYGYAAKAMDSGDARFVRITDINKDGKLSKENPMYVELNEENEKYTLDKNDLLMARTGATFGKTMIFEEDYPAVYAGFLIKLNLNETIINAKYYWHFAQSDFFWEQANKLVSGGGQPQFNANALKQVRVPIPYPSHPQKSLDEQGRIVDILDKFDAIAASITEGLPREIELRQKQYEYYRDLLFSFPKPETVSN
ncbi:restriction endonuclease subunit S [Escherichia coli]|uniref:restriction endonuclease subunit S n=4 Tax=Escherichia coli TaxID=562 RepID=UPI000B3E941F|nr:restriction endonuclease subunit S [Escherichia coli]EFI2795789.1 restriction endonuclease subunit S [Escherichia coli]ELO3317056.1 restriction endonuclease subunit S [Escherichia coli]NEG76359.1 restriction endonuclease subunit S [Escherichia coli]